MSSKAESSELGDVFAAPKWLRDAGLTSWLLAGVALFAVGAVWLMSLTAVIVLPVIVAAVVAAVASPLVGWLHRHRVPRAAGAALVLVGIAAVATGLILLTLFSITGEVSSIGGHLGDAKDEITGWLEDAGVDPAAAENAKDDASSSIGDAFSALLTGLSAGISALAGLAFFLAMTVLSLFFLLKDGPLIRSWTERHIGVPLDAARLLSQRTLESFRGYFLGVTIVAAFSAVIVFIGSLIIGVPQAGTIAVVTFLGGYIPYLGAWGAAGFAVLIALGGSGPEAAGAMIVLQLLANGLLQQLVQPFAMGAALGIHPLAVLIVTIAGGALFGAVGLILAAPLTAAATRIATDLRAGREEPAPPGAAVAPAARA